MLPHRGRARHAGPADRGRRRGARRPRAGADATQEIGMEVPGAASGEGRVEPIEVPDGTLRRHRQSVVRPGRADPPTENDAARGGDRREIGPARDRPQPEVQPLRRVLGAQDGVLEERRVQTPGRPALRQRTER